MSKNNFKITPKKFISHIESEYDLKNITVNDLPVWQFLRNIIFSHLFKNNRVEKKNKSILNLINSFSLNRRGKADYVLFTDSNELIKTKNGQYVDKIAQNFIDLLNEQLMIVINPLNRLNMKIKNNNNFMFSTYFHLKRRFHKIPENIITNQSDLNEVCKKINFNYSPYIDLFFTYHDIFNLWLDKIQPKGVFINCGYSLFHQALIYSCNKKNIHTAELQHGLISEGHTQYSINQDVGQDAMPSHFLTFSNYYSRFINDNFIDRSNIYEIGHFYRERKIKNKNLECEKMIEGLRKKYKKIILVSSQDIIEKKLINSVQDIALKRPEYYFIFKQRHLSQTNIQAENIMVDEKYSIYDFLNLIDCNLSCFSTNVLESLSNKTIGVLMDYDNLASQYFGQIVKDCEGIFICQNNGDAIQALDSKLKSKSYSVFYKDNNKKNVAQFLNTFFE
tara:strand:+ start:390 stop:1733 length:1344 start_codon:yes stop_codon:yes gene_type:complete